MPSYENDNCPVCGRKFTNNDDIVTCPYCGTPHHRECYNSVGHCANSDKHGTDFSFTPTPADKDKNADNQNAQNSNEHTKQTYYTPPSEDGKTFCPSCGAQIDANAPFCSNCGAKQQKGENDSSRFSSNSMGSVFNSPETGYENNTQTVSGKSLSDIACVIRTNAKKFIPKFIKDKKISWNWSAFIFGPFYLFFRKMSKEGILALAVRLIISLVAQGLYAEPYANFYNFAYSNYESLTSNSADSSLLAQFEELYTAVLPMFVIIIVGTLIINTVTALFFDSTYKKKVLGIIDKVDENIDDDSIVDQSFIMSETQIPGRISENDVRKLYLGRFGGTSIFAPFIAYFVYDLITSLISSL
ncbi:MAG: zinc-ribbon domain-containing protein [Clostridiales bacterium]|nr:zinc-ribbon domain-containing protein [Clostridiales bacterium]